MSNHRALLEEFATMLTANGTQDRSRTIDAYVVTAVKHHNGSNVTIHWKVDGHRISFKKLLAQRGAEYQWTDRVRSSDRKYPVQPLPAHGPSAPLFGDRSA